MKFQDYHIKETNLDGVFCFKPLPAEFDPFTATSDVLNRYGIDERPDKHTDPKKYAKWKRQLQYERVVPTLIETEYKNSAFRKADDNGTSLNWSGFVIEDPNNPFLNFCRIYVDMTVPGMILPNPANETHVSLWIGIDGYGSPDVCQAGVHVINRGGNVDQYAWYEWFPNFEVKVDTNSFPVYVGNTIEIVVDHYIYSGVDRTGVTISNINTNKTIGFMLTPPAGTRLIGNTIEWVVERPDINGQPTTLLPYTNIVMTDSMAQANNPMLNYYPGQAPTGQIQNLSMVDNNNRIISQVALGPPTQYNGHTFYDNIIFLYNENFD